MAQALKFSDGFENTVSHPPLFKWLPQTEWRVSKRKKKVYLNTTQYITNCICVSEESQRK